MSPLSERHSRYNLGLPSLAVFEQEQEMNEEPSPGSLKDAWIISPGRQVRFALSPNGHNASPATGREFRISALGRYLVEPKAIYVTKELAGCEIHWKRPLKRSLLARIFKAGNKDDRGAGTALILMDGIGRHSRRLSDPHLRNHVARIEEKLRDFDELHMTLDGIDLARVDKVVGLCRDLAGNQFKLILEGDASQQLDFVRHHVQNEVTVQLACAHRAEGLFELQGFRRNPDDSGKVWRLIRMNREGRPAACVLDEDHSVAFWLGHPDLIQYLQLFEYALQGNAGMRDNLRRCLAGEAVPLRLLFNHDLEIDYRDAPLPAVFQEVLDDGDQVERFSQVIKPNLNHHQLSVAFSSMIAPGTPEEKHCTDIAVLQDVRALEPIREHFPRVFAAMTERASRFDAGRYYLLESISGVAHDH
jgi:hypothetical protein